MTLLKWFTQFKSKETNSIPHATPLDSAYIEGLNKGLEIGLQISSEIDKKIIERVKERAISETLERLNADTKNK
jgi:hypothetical protein